MPNLSISLLGVPRIEQDGTPIAVDTRKAIALIAFLAVTNRTHKRDRLARLLWDGDLPHARAALRRTLSVLRKALVGDWLYSEKDLIGLQSQAGLWLDVEVFLERLAIYEAHQHQDGAICRHCLPLLQEAVSLYRDSFLAGFLLGDGADFSQWQLTEAAFLQRKQASALQALLFYHAQTGAYDTAVTFAHRWLQLDPTHEPAHQWLMKLYAWQGETAKAAHQYHECVRLLAQTVGLQPQPETTTLFNQIQSGHPPQKPALVHDKPPPAPLPFAEREHFHAPHHVPRQLTPLIGRVVELREIQTRFDHPRCRLLTLTGIGGAGKTRLAIEFAGKQTASFKHGVYYVPLAAINSADYLVSAIADAVQFSLSGPDAKKQLLRFLHDKEMLLVLDNFEHLLDAADLLVEILEQAPAVKLLVTSRICLNYRVEWLYEVGGLTCAPDDAVTAVPHGAMELFLYHAHRLNPHFAPSAAESASILHICHLLDGIPLGVELAAALLRQFSGVQIAAGIAQNLDFLQTTMRDVPPQHRSLRAVFESSWQFLTPAEQELLQQLAVFQGSFSQEAVFAITAAAPTLLTDLVDKSLLQERADGRYQMHDLIQQYAREKLQTYPLQAATTSERHGRYFLAFLQRHSDELKTAVQAQALATMRQDIDNVHTAWHWAVSQQEGTELAHVIDGLCLLYDFFNWFHEGRKVFAEAADSLSSAATPGIIASLRARQAFFLHRLSLFPEAKALLLECLSLSRQQQQLPEIMFCLTQLGTVAFFLGEYDEAKTYLDESLAFGHKMEEPWHLAYCYNSLGNVYRVLGDYQAAHQSFSQALQLRRECGDKRGIAVTLNNLGSTAETVGDYEEARRLLQESFTLKKALGDRKGAGLSMLNLGRVLALLGHNAEAQKLLSDSFTIFQEVGESAGAALAMTNQGNIAYALGQLAEARDFYCESLKISQAITDRRGIVFSLNDLGKVALAQNNYPEAQTYFCRALTIAAEMKSTPQMLEALTGIADLIHIEGNSETALDLLLLILDHRALDRETREYAVALQKNVERQLGNSLIPAAGQNRPERDLFTVAQLVPELFANRL